MYILEYNSKTNNLFELHDYVRLKSLVKQFKNIIVSKILPIKINYDLIDYNIFVTSTITAYKLFDLYANGTLKQKKYIIQNIQNIFDGNMQLEEFLNELNINFDNKVKRKVI